MKKTDSKIELVAPAGGPEQFVAALNAGADAVYLGYTKYGARAYAGNFSFGQLRWAARRARSSGKKIYLTLNTILKDHEVPGLLDFLNNYLKVSDDGIIIQDMGLLKMMSELFPGIPVHASTQMNIHNTRSLDLASSAGFARAVLAREMTLDEIETLSPKNNIKLEAFGHGSQCYSYSGLCYLSSFTGGRSGNRGRCTQPCRMRYEPMPAEKEKIKKSKKKPLFLLSKNDLCTLDILPGIIKSGIDALKIEGRMKTPEYVAIVTKIYRKYIDLYYSRPAKYSVDHEDRLKIRQIFSRELGTGYYEGDFEDIVDPEKSGSIGNLAGRIKRIIPGKKNKKASIIIAGKMDIRQGDILEIWTKKGNRRLKIKEVESSTRGKRHEHVIEVDSHRPYSPKDRVFKYFDSKLDGEAKALFMYDRPGGTGGRDTVKGIHTGNWLKKYLEKNNIDDPEKINRPTDTGRTSISLRIYDIKDAGRAADSGTDNIIISDHKGLFAAPGPVSGHLERLKGLTGKIIIDTPDIIYDRDMDNILAALNQILALENIRVRISNIGLLEALKGSIRSGSKEKYIRLGSTLNISNTLSASFYHSFSPHIEGWEFSPEIEKSEIADIISSYGKNHRDGYVFSIFAHGYFRVLTARHSLRYERKKDIVKSPIFLKDRKNYRFRVLEDEKHNTNIYNSKKTCLFFDLDKVLSSGINDLILDSRFTSIDDMTEVVKSYRQALSLMQAGREGDYTKYADSLRHDPLFTDYSRGHLFRGVE